MKSDQPIFKIEKGVPIPSRTAPKYPFMQMEVGDSVLITGERKGSVTGAAFYVGKTHGMKFTSRSVGGGVRVWRIA